MGRRVAGRFREVWNKVESCVFPHNIVGCEGRLWLPGSLGSADVRKKLCRWLSKTKRQEPGFWSNIAYLQEDGNGEERVGRKACLRTAVQMPKSLTGRCNWLIREHQVNGLGMSWWVPRALKPWFTHLQQLSRKRLSGLCDSKKFTFIAYNTLWCFLISVFFLLYSSLSRPSMGIPHHPHFAFLWVLKT